MIMGQHLLSERLENLLPATFSGRSHGCVHLFTSIARTDLTVPLTKVGNFYIPTRSRSFEIRLLCTPGCHWLSLCVASSMLPNGFLRNTSTGSSCKELLWTTCNIE